MTVMGLGNTLNPTVQDITIAGYGLNCRSPIVPDSENPQGLSMDIFDKGRFQ